MSFVLIKIKVPPSIPTNFRISKVATNPILPTATERILKVTVEHPLRFQ